MCVLDNSYNTYGLKRVGTNAVLFLKFGIATDYGLEGTGSNPGGGRDFLPVQTGPGVHPASCTMGTGSFPGVKRPGRDADHSPPF